MTALLGLGLGFGVVVLQCSRVTARSAPCRAANPNRSAPCRAANPNPKHRVERLTLTAAHRVERRVRPVAALACRPLRCHAVCRAPLCHRAVRGRGRGRRFADGREVEPLVCGPPGGRVWQTDGRVWQTDGRCVWQTDGRCVWQTDGRCVWQTDGRCVRQTDGRCVWQTDGRCVWQTDGRAHLTHLT
jgi:hypothetical protein